MVQTESTSLSKGVLVQIDGLASEAGKPLNGAYGLIASDPANAASSASGVVRYPVLVYALHVSKGGDEGEEEEQTYAIIKTSVDAPKSLKGANLRALSDQKQKLFQEVVRVQGQLAHRSANHPGALLWYEAYYDRWPDGDGDLGIVLTYIELLLNFTKQPKKALEAVDHVKPLVKPPRMDAAMCDHFLVMYVQICTAAGERLEEALDIALQIDTSTDGGKERAMRALAFLLKYSSERNETDLTREHPDMLDLQVRVAQRIYELDPQTVDNLFNLGAAHCLRGDNLEGCKCYRRALATGAGDPYKRRYHEQNLITAQLQCPGMPLEGYIIVTGDSKCVSCIKESDKEYCKIVTTRLGFGKGSGSLQVDGKDVVMLNFPLPSSPDDPEVFPKSFLESLME